MADYSLADVARIFDLSPARLRYWQRTELIPASPGDASQPAFGFRDLVCIRAVIALLARGVPVRRIRRSVAAIRERLPEIERPLDSLRVWVEGSDRVVVRHQGTLMEPDGQLVLDLALAPEEREDVLPLRPTGAPAAERDATAALEWFEIGCRLDADPARREEAAAAYRRAVACDPDFADAHCNLGALLQQRGERPAARACYEAAVGADPLHVEARFNLAGGRGPPPRRGALQSGGAPRRGGARRGGAGPLPRGGALGPDVSRRPAEPRAPLRPPRPREARPRALAALPGAAPRWELGAARPQAPRGLSAPHSGGR